MEATWTASPTLELTPTDTPRPTITPSSHEYVVLTCAAHQDSQAQCYTYKAESCLFSGSVTQVESTIIHPDLACNWAGIGGTVVDANNSPVIGTVVVCGRHAKWKTIDPDKHTR